MQPLRIPVRDWHFGPFQALGINTDVLALGLAWPTIFTSEVSGQGQGGCLICTCPMQKAWWGYILLYCCDERIWYFDYDLGTTDSYFCEYADEDFRQIACVDNFGCF